MFSGFTHFIRRIGLLPVLVADDHSATARAAGRASRDAAAMHDRAGVRRWGEPAMDGIPDAVQRTPPAAASPGLPPVDPVVEVPLSNEAVCAGLPEGAPESNYPGHRVILGAAPGSPNAGDPIKAEPSPDVRQGVTCAVELNPLPAGVNPCADPSTGVTDAAAQEGLEQGSSSRWFDDARHDDEPFLPFILDAYWNPAFDVEKERDADPVEEAHCFSDGVGGVAAAQPTLSSLVVDSRAGDRLPRASKPDGKAHRVPPRVADRPRVEEWTDDELLTLPEAAALFWPAGPITTNTLRTAERDGTLMVAKVAGKFFTTPQAIRRMGAEKAIGKNIEVPDETSPATLFQMKLAEARRLGGGRARPKRAAKRAVVPASDGGAQQ